MIINEFSTKEEMLVRIAQLEQDNATLTKQLYNLARYKSLELERRTRQTSIQDSLWKSQ